MLLVTPRWARDGGVAAHVTASAKLLAQRGIEVDVMAAQVDPSVRACGVNVIHIPHLFDARAPMTVRLGGPGFGRADVVHVHQVDDPEIVAALGERAPVAVSAHGYTACTSGVYYFRPGKECTRAHGPGCALNLAARGCAHTRHPRTLPLKYRQAGRGAAALARADLVIAYSSSVDRHLAANGLARRKLVPLFTTMAVKRGTGHAARRRVVFAGRVAAAKGVDVLIRAARDVEAEFIICGDGWRLPAMRRLARRLGVERRVEFRGWLDGGRLAQELADASLVAIPSRWPEPFGLVGIEALAAGRPVVASNTGGIPDWLEHGVTGLCVPPGDAAALAEALDELLADTERQRKMGAAGRQMVAERFSPERHFEALIECYQAARAWAQNRRGIPRPDPTAL